MTSIFEQAVQHTLMIEDDFVDDPRDSGGATRYGITEVKARAWGYDGPIAALPKSLALAIYRRDFWDLLWLDEVARIAPPVALEMFDTAVNCGPELPVQHLQRCLNLFNMNGSLYPDLKVDGAIGGVTLSALRAFATRRGNIGVKVLVEALNSLQGAFYTELAERRPKDEAFVFGWFRNRVLKRSV